MADHLMKETSKSTWSEEAISFLISLSMLGSFLLPVKRAFSTMEVWGRMGVICWDWVSLW